MTLNKFFLFDDNARLEKKFLIGADEAGRGPGAGPVYTAAVCFHSVDENVVLELAEINDSKKLSKHTREELFEVIKANSFYSIKSVSVEEIQKFNISKAALYGMKQAIQDVIVQTEEKDLNSFKILIDGNLSIPHACYEQEKVIKGDGKSAAIAGASILAKVARDNFMDEIDKEFPMYNWRENKGYLTPDHLEAIDKYGMTKWHREKYLRAHFAKNSQLSLLELL